MTTREALKGEVQQKVWPLFGEVYTLMERGKYGDGIKLFRKTLKEAKEVGSGYAGETVREVVKEAIIESTKTIYRHMKDSDYSKKDFKEGVIDFSKKLTEGLSYVKERKVADILKKRVRDNFMDKEEVVEIYQEITGK